MIQINVGTDKFPVPTLIDLQPGAVRNRIAKAMKREEHGWGLIGLDDLPVDLTLDKLARLFTEREIANALDRAAKFQRWCVEQAAGVVGTADPTPRTSAASPSRPPELAGLIAPPLRTVSDLDRSGVADRAVVPVCWQDPYAAEALGIALRYCCGTVAALMR